MGYVVNNSDNIEWVVDENGNRVFDRKYNNKDNTVAPVMSLSSRIDGTYCVSQVVPESSKQTLWITSARIQKAAVGSQVPYGSETTPQLQTSETPLDSSSASTNIIYENGENVNTRTKENSNMAENVENSVAEIENAPDTTDTASGLNLAEGEILSLKHTKNVYSLFKGAARVVVGKDVITDGKVAIPLTDESIAEIKKVYKGEIGENENISLARFYHKDNDVLIQGNPKVYKTTVRGVTQDAYAFILGDRAFCCPQKYIDAFNNNGNVITAKYDPVIPWTVHDKNGNFVALFMALTPKDVSNYESLPTVRDVLANKNTQSTPTNKGSKKKKIIRAKKADWSAHDVSWYAPNSKTVIAYSTFSASDLINIMCDDYPAMTISNMHDAINYDAEAKKVLMAYINSGFGDEIASEHFGDPTKKRNAAESVTKEGETVTETPESVIETPESVVESNAPKSTVKMSIDTKSQTDNKKSLLWSQSRGLKLPKLADTNSGSTDIILQKDNIVNRNSNIGEITINQVANAKFSIMERSNNREQAENTQNDISYGNSRRSNDESAVRKTRSVFRTGKEILKKNERAEYVKTLKRGQDTEVKNFNGVRCEFINESAYNEDIAMLVDDLKVKGFAKVGVFIGTGKVAFSQGSFNAAIVENDGQFNEIYVRYDDPAYSPRQHIMHELGHSIYNTKLGQKIRNIIENSLSIAEKKAWLSNSRYQRYMGILNNEDLVFEELVCDILGGMAPDNVRFEVLSSAFWNNNFEVIDNFKVSEYTKSIDAGGAAKKLSIDNFKQLMLPKQEYAMVSKAIANKNAGLKNLELQSVDYVFAADNFYVYENKSVGEFIVIDKLNPETDSERISTLIEVVNNGIYSNTDRIRLNRLLADVRSGKGSYNRNNGRLENRNSTVANDRVYSSQSTGDTVGHTDGISENTTSGRIKLSLTDDGYFDLIDLAEGKYTDAEIKAYAEPTTKKKDATRSRKDTKASRDTNNAASYENRWNTEKVEANEKPKNTPVNIADIVKKISEKFEIPISTGKVTDREASGIYKEKVEAIRTRITNNLPTISHELGHHLDKHYRLSKIDSVKKLRRAIPAEFLENYSANETNGEAVAEFVRVYLRNKNEADRLCPDFYADFVKTLSKADLKALNEIASSVNAYLSYNISERYDAAIVSSKKSEKHSFKEKWHKLYTDWVDAFYPLKEAVDYVEEVKGETLSGKGNAYILATNSLNAHTIANYLICEGFRDLDGNVIDAKSFIDSISMVDAKNVKLLDKYLVLRHSLEWIAPEQEDVTAKRVFADDTLENIEEIKKQISDIEREHPEIKTAAENLYEYQNNVLNHFVIPAGGMTDKMLDELNKKYPSYVPFYRAVGKKSGFAKGTFANQRSPIMRAKGSGALIISPTESIIRNTEKMVKFALRNQTADTLGQYADTVEGFGQFMEKVTPDMIPHTSDLSKHKEKFADALQQLLKSSDDYFAISEAMDTIFGDAVTDFTPVANANKKIVTVLKNGRPTYYQIHDDALYRAVAEMSPQQLEGLAKWSNMIMQPMKMLTTQNNPIFAATNALRDFGTAYKLSDTNNPIAFAVRYAIALKGIITNSESYKQYKAMGGGHSSDLSANIDDISRTLRKVSQKDMGKARRLAYSIFLHPVETVARFNDLIESTPRFAEFQRTLKADGDLQEAIFNASDITTNFSKKGGSRAAKEANTIFMYNNAAIQGLDKVYRTFKDPKKGMLLY